MNKHNYTVQDGCWNCAHMDSFEDYLEPGDMTRSCVLDGAPSRDLVCAANHRLWSNGDARTPEERSARLCAFKKEWYEWAKAHAVYLFGKCGKWRKATWAAISGGET